LPALARTLALALLALAPEDIAHARLAVALPDVLSLAIIEAKLILVERTNRHFDGTLAVRQNNRFIRDDGAEVLLNRLFDALFMAVLVDDAFTL
jgi:hypothetical protein